MAFPGEAIQYHLWAHPGIAEVVVFLVVGTRRYSPYASATHQPYGESVTGSWDAIASLMTKLKILRGWPEYTHGITGLMLERLFLEVLEPVQDRTVGALHHLLHIDQNLPVRPGPELFPIDILQQPYGRGVFSVTMIENATREVQHFIAAQTARQGGAGGTRNHQQQVQQGQGDAIRNATSDWAWQADDTLDWLVANLWCRSQTYPHREDHLLWDAISKLMRLMYASSQYHSFNQDFNRGSSVMLHFFNFLNRSSIYGGIPQQRFAWLPDSLLLGTTSTGFTEEEIRNHTEIFKHIPARYRAPKQPTSRQEREGLSRKAAREQEVRSHNLDPRGIQIRSRGLENQTESRE